MTTRPIDFISAAAPGSGMPFSGIDVAVVAIVAAIVGLAGFALQRRHGAPRGSARPNEEASPRETVLRAQQQFKILAFGIAPAAAAGALVGMRLDSFGEATIVTIAVAAVSLVMQRPRVPLHLMPLASMVVRIAAPVVGLALSLATLAFAGRPESATEMIVPLVGAWIISAFASWLNLRFETSRKVRVAIIGSTGLAIGLAREFEIAGIRSHEVAGWITDKGQAREADGEPHWLGSFDELRTIVEDRSIELLVHSNGAWSSEEQPRRSRLELFDEVATACLDLPVRLVEATQLYEDLLGHVPLGQANSAWFQYMLHPRFRAGSLGLKRGFDVIVAIAMLLMLSPMLAVFATLIKLTDGGPIFYRQRRVGEKGCEFEMIKLRSMRVDSETVGPQWSVANDDRVTSVGGIMRRLHIDEMPQLWNILRGDMTVVGPRPERPELIVSLEQQLSYYDRRHLVKPGLAGWAQACCGYSGTAGGTSWKLCHDLYYLKHRSVYFDLLILIENVRVSLRNEVQFGLAVPQEQFIIGG